jgi:4-amino-4-deoxy-L-arabinose transferase-like glycosyltransferase
MKPNLPTGFPYRSFLLWVGLGLLTSSYGLITRTLHYDEIFEIRLALKPVSQQILQYAHPQTLDFSVHALSPPLFHILQHPILVLFGDTAFAARAISWLTGAVNVALIYSLLARLVPVRLAALGALGFMLSFWHIALSQTGRQHSLFLTFVLLSLLLFGHAERKGRHFSLYALALAAASHVYYWGFLVVLPTQIVATLVLKRQLTHWRRALVAQVAAAATALPYIFAIVFSYQKMTNEAPPLLFTVPYFATVLVEFTSASWGWLDAWSLPWITLVALVALVVMVRGVLRWSKEHLPFARWLGLCCIGWFLILFSAYVMGGSFLAGVPLIRKFAIIQIPLLLAFVYGVASLPSRLGLLVVLMWTASTAVFGVRFMASDYYKASEVVAERIARLEAPVQIYSSPQNYARALSFFLERAGKIEGFQIHPFDVATRLEDFIAAADRATPRDGSLCFAFMREGGSLRADFEARVLKSKSSKDPDATLHRAVDLLASRLRDRGWTRTASESYPGRVSFQLACFSAG